MTVKNLIMASLLLTSSHAYADGGKAMVLKSTNEATQSYAVTNISSVKYENGKMLLTLKNGSVQMFSVSDIKSMTFASVATAIESMANGEAKSFTIYDESGSLIVSGVTDDEGKFDMPINLRGVYLIKVGNVAKKVVVK